MRFKLENKGTGLKSDVEYDLQSGQDGMHTLTFNGKSHKNLDHEKLKAILREEIIRNFSRKGN